MLKMFTNLKQGRQHVEVLPGLTTLSTWIASPPGMSMIIGNSQDTQEIDTLTSLDWDT